MGQSVQELLYELNSERVRNLRAQIRKRFKVTEEELEIRKEARDAEQAAINSWVATRLHLLDLKRAGHSPRHTEYYIPTERPVPLRNYRTHGSIMGSPGAMCGEEGSKAGSMASG